MQAINRIQNAMINANANMQGAMVVNSANAHRAYTSFKPCDPKRVSKCPGQSPRPVAVSTVVPITGTGLTPCGSGRLTGGSTGETWRRDYRDGQMPARLWAALVLSCHTCG